MAETQVLIVGAGPTGPAMALWLARLGAPFGLSKRTVGQDRPPARWRCMRAHSNSTASSVSPMRLSGAGIKAETFRLREGGREMAVLNLVILARD